MRMWAMKMAVSVVLASLVLPPPANAQNEGELAKQTQNPIASLISVPFQGNWDFGLGDRDAAGVLLNFQPVVPFAINPSTNIVLRVIMPLTSQPGSASDGARINGMGDILTTAFFSPSKGGPIIWGVGPAVLLPTATNNTLGTEKFAVGPSVVVLTQPGKFTFGLLFNHLWSTSGANDRDDVNQTLLQPFANYNLGGGLALGVNTEASANWEAEEPWTAPLHFNVSKVTLLGERPVNLAMHVAPFVAAPSGGASWRFRLVATFLYPR